MASITQANYRYAFHYFQELYEANQRYLSNGHDSSLALSDFDINFDHFENARKWLSKYVDELINTGSEPGEVEWQILDLCNSYPDAGAYLVSIRLTAYQRINWLKSALNASLKLNTPVTTQAHLGNLGLAYSELGEISSAIHYFEKALKLAIDIGDQYHQGAWLGNLGNTYAHLGDHEKAINYHQRHLEIAVEMGSDRAEGHALTNLGVSFAYLGKKQKSLECYSRCLDLAMKQNDLWEQSQALLNLGLIYFDIGDLDLSRLYLEKALVISEEFNDIATKVLILGSLADIDIDQKHFKLAEETLTGAIQLVRESHPDVSIEMRLLQSLGNVYLASDDYQKGLEINKQLLELAENIEAKGNICSALCNLCSLYFQLGQIDQASFFGQRGLLLSKEIGLLSSEAFIHWQLGLIYEFQNEKTKAVTEMEMAIRIETQIDGTNLDKHKAYFSQIQ